MKTATGRAARVRILALAQNTCTTMGQPSASALIEPSAHSCQLAQAALGSPPDCIRQLFEAQTFDGAFMHAVVQHLRDPVEALREVHRVLRPGAVIGVADADLSLDLLYPATTGMVRSMRLFAELRRADGGAPDAGRRLRELLHLAGFVRCIAAAKPVADGTQEGIASTGQRWSAYFSAPPLIERMEQVGLATSAELLEMANDWRDWSTNAAAFCAALWCEAVAWK